MRRVAVPLLLALTAASVACRSSADEPVATGPASTTMEASTSPAPSEEPTPSVVATPPPAEIPAGIPATYDEDVPARELPAVGHGGSAEGRLTFSVKPAAKTGPARFELRVETAEGRLYARVPVETLIE